MALTCPRCDGTLAIERDGYGIDIVCIQGSHRWYEGRPAALTLRDGVSDALRHLPRVSKQHRGEETDAAA